MRVYCAVALLLSLPLGLLAGADERDFSGNWTLDQEQSNLRGLPVSPGPVLTIGQQGSTLRCTDAGGAWAFRLDNTESNYKIKDSIMSAESKWEGSALLINTLVSGPQNYVIEDRWQMSRNRTTLTITRTIRRGMSETEARLVYRNADRLEALRDANSAPPEPSAAGESTEVVVKAGTKIPLSLVNSLNTKHTAEGDRVYLETAFPIILSGHIVIPKGSYVAGTVTEVKRAGRVKGKAEMFLRFDSLTLPNGVTRDFRSRLDNADGQDVDRQEGKIRGDGNRGGDVKTVGEATAAGASVGAIAGGLAGHGPLGLGVGAAGGAAAGLLGVLLSRGPDLVLPKGTTFEMVLDRDLRYEPQEVGPR
jgi:hypothetical protein